MESIVQLAIPLALLVLGYFTGSHLERRHFASLRKREARLKGQPYMTLDRVPAGRLVRASGLVSGSVVVSLDYFKRFLAGLRAIVGGRLRAYEPLLDRARREALLRMREQAEAQGFDQVINVRLQTSRLATGGADGGGATIGVEVLAFGTGLTTDTSS